MKRPLVSSDEDIDKEVKNIKISNPPRQESDNVESDSRSCDSDSDLPLSASFSKRKQNKKALRKKAISLNSFDAESSPDSEDGNKFSDSEDDEPLSTLILSSQNKKPEKSSKLNFQKDDRKYANSSSPSASSLSDEKNEENGKLSDKPPKSTGKSNRKSSSSSNSSDNSDSESVNDKDEKTAPKICPNTANEHDDHELSSSDPSPINSEEEVEDKLKIQHKLSNKQAKSNNSSSKKDPLSGYKRYLRTIGVSIRHYETFFQGCKSVKAKKDKLLNVMREKGLKGRPSMNKCKALRLKIERKKEIDELDLDNIISDSGRAKRRNVESLYATREVKDDSKLFNCISDSPAKPSKARILSSDSESDSD